MKLALFNAQPPACPNCGDAKIYRSRRRGPVENILHRIFRISPYRCEPCDFRHFRFRKETSPHSVGTPRSEHVSTLKGRLNAEYTEAAEKSRS